MNISRRDVGALCAALLAVTACGSGGGGDAANSPDPAAGTTMAVESTVEPAPSIEVDQEAPIASASSEPDSTPEAATRTIVHVFGTSEVPANPLRVVALSEEFLLADLLALGVTPVASTANDQGGFVGLDPALTENIEPIASASFNLERLAALRPDLIVAYPDYIDLVGYDLVNAIAPTVAIGTVDSDWREKLLATAEVFGLEAKAASRVDEIEAELAAVRAAIQGRRVSVASVSPGPFIRAFTDDRTALTQLMAELGVVFVPDGGDTDDNGRIEVSLEQLGILSGDSLVLLQSPSVEGVDAALAAVQSSPLWSTLPAVRNDSVVVLDQFAYFGADGVAAFARDLAEALVGAG
jgi:iron complex transport system substrate-binding protein